VLLECDIDATEERALLRVVTVVDARRLGVDALWQTVKGEDVAALYEKAHAVDADGLRQCCGQGVTYLEILQAYVVALLHPERRSQTVGASVAHVAKGKTRIFAPGVVEAVAVLHEPERRIGALLERLRPYRVVISTIIIGAEQRHAEVKARGKLCAEVEPVPVSGQVQAHHVARTVALSRARAVALPGNFAVTVEVFILDVADVRARTIPCRVVNLLFRTVQTFGYPALNGVDARANHLQLTGGIGAVGIAKPLVLGIGHVQRKAVVERMAAHTEVVAVREGPLHTIVGIAVIVLIGREIAAHRRGLVAAHLGEDVIIVVVEPVELNAQLTVPQRGVEADVRRPYLGPREIQIGNAVGIERLGRRTSNEPVASLYVGGQIHVFGQAAVVAQKAH